MVSILTLTFGFYFGFGFGFGQLAGWSVVFADLALLSC
jgi:hypothetical protein